MAVAESKIAYSVLEAADQLGMHKTTVYDLIRAGEIRAVRMGPSRKKIGIKHDDLVAYVDRSPAYEVL